VSAALAHVAPMAAKPPALVFHVSGQRQLVSAASIEAEGRAYLERAARVVYELPGGRPEGLQAFADAVGLDGEGGAA
jgi:hypothetical protein